VVALVSRLPGGGFTWSCGIDAKAGRRTNGSRMSGFMAPNPIRLTSSPERIAVVETPKDRGKSNFLNQEIRSVSVRDSSRMSLSPTATLRNPWPEFSRLVSPIKRFFRSDQERRPMSLSRPFRTLPVEITSRFCLADADQSNSVSAAPRRLGEDSGFPGGSNGRRIAELAGGRLTFDGPLASLAAPLLDLHRRIVTAIVAAQPLPGACLHVPELDHFVAECQASWDGMASGFQVDPDIEGWGLVLLADTDAAFIAWCFSCLCEISGGGLVRIDDMHSSNDSWIEQEPAEWWITAEPELLAADLRLALGGGPLVMAVDPLRQRFKSAI
jgi:hypothetical protein